MTCIWKIQPWPGACRYIGTKYVYTFNTLRPRRMAAISRTTFSNTFSWIKMYQFRLRFLWSLFLKLQLTIFQHCFSIGSDNGLAQHRRQAIIWTNDDPVQRRIYASLDLEKKLEKKKNVSFLDFKYKLLWQTLKWCVFCQDSLLLDSTKAFESWFKYRRNVFQWLH